MNKAPLPALIIEPPGPHRSTVIWLHGLGADGHDFEPVVAELRLPESLGVRFVLPHAPVCPVTINGGYRMPAWYDIVSPDLSLAPDEAGICASREAVLRLVERELAAGVAPERLILAGFSQGSVIALETAAWHQDRLGGAICLSGYVASPERLPAATRPFPVFMAHGTQDTIVPYALGLAARRTLEAKGYAVEWHGLPLAHSVSWEEIAAIRAWLLRRLDAG